MIVTKTPVRISLGAGGTDLPAYYRRHGAKFATAAGSRYVYVMVNRHPEKIVWMGMFRAERVDSPDELKHNIVRNVLDWMDLRENIEIVSTSDTSPNSGLGNSSSFIVGLLKALHAYKGEYPWPEEIAKEACHVEQNLLGEVSGKQDAYAASLGGVIWMEISKGGKVTSSRLAIKREFASKLADSLAFIYTGVQRESSQIQNRHASAMVKGEARVIESLTEIERIASRVRTALEKEDIVEFGKLMKDHWMCKRDLSKDVTNPTIEALYEMGMKLGSVGGNVMGAGGGGHIMFVCKDREAKDRLVSGFAKQGYRAVDMRFEMQGSTITKI